MIPATVYEVEFDDGEARLFAASGPHHLDTLLREYGLQEAVVGIECRGRLANLRLGELHPQDVHYECGCDGQRHASRVASIPPSRRR